MTSETFKKVLREYSEKSKAVANSLGGVGYVFYSACFTAL